MVSAVTNLVLVTNYWTRYNGPNARHIVHSHLRTGSIIQCLNLHYYITIFLNIVVFFSENLVIQVVNSYVFTEIEIWSLETVRGNEF